MERLEAIWDCGMPWEPPVPTPSNCSFVILCSTLASLRLVSQKIVTSTATTGVVILALRISAPPQPVLSSKVWRSTSTGP